MEGGAEAILFKGDRGTASLQNPTANGYQQGFDFAPFHVAVYRIGEYGRQCFPVFTVHAHNMIAKCDSTVKGKPP